MPVHIDKMSSDATVFTGDMPLNQAQLEQLVQLVLRRLEEKQNLTRFAQEGSHLRSTSIPVSRTELG